MGRWRYELLPVSEYDACRLLSAVLKHKESFQDRVRNAGDVIRANNATHAHHSSPYDCRCCTLSLPYQGKEKIQGDKPKPRLLKGRVFGFICGNPEPAFCSDSSLCSIPRSLLLVEKEVQ